MSDVLVVRLHGQGGLDPLGPRRTRRCGDWRTVATSRGTVRPFFAPGTCWSLSVDLRLRGSRPRDPCRAPAAPRGCGWRNCGGADRASCARPFVDAEAGGQGHAARAALPQRNPQRRLRRSIGWHGDKALTRTTGAGCRDAISPVHASGDGLLKRVGGLGQRLRFVGAGRQAFPQIPKGDHDLVSSGAVQSRGVGEYLRRTRWGYGSAGAPRLGRAAVVVESGAARGAPPSRWTRARASATWNCGVPTVQSGNERQCSVAMARSAGAPPCRGYAAETRCRACARS